MTKGSPGVHIAHCCVFHGCKYGDPDCPVMNLQAVQEYPCEDCDDDTGVEIINNIQKVIDETPLDDLKTIAVLTRLETETTQILRASRGIY